MLYARLFHHARGGDSTVPGSDNLSSGMKRRMDLFTLFSIVKRSFMAMFWPCVFDVR